MNSDATALELMVDRLGVAGVLRLLADVCGEKAEHIRTNWQDKATAKPWDAAASTVGKALTQVSV